MFVSSRHETPSSLQIKVPWDPNTARGFFFALIITSLLLLISSVIYFEPLQEHVQIVNTIPVINLSFGDGDGTGVSRGNLSSEGHLLQGKNPQTDLSNAEVSARTKYQKDASVNDIDQASAFIPKDRLLSDSKIEQNSGTSNRNIGSPSGDNSGFGLGSKGTGAGKGLGLGDIEWGGGGNRTVLQKKLPQFPPGVDKSAQIKIRFTVFSDGTVGKMLPIQRGDPSLERAAMEALRQWRFNPLKDNIEMVGIITFTFKLS
ncbi:MAG: TonB family protein [Ignavibacteria bacterium]|nr:TonB family protein [Ignavibacteria bacterium]